MLPGLASVLAGAASGPSGIQFVGASQLDSRSSGGSLSLTSLTGGIDTEAREGDLVIVALSDSGSVDGNLTITTPSGFTEVADLYANDAGGDVELGAYWKLMTATPDTSVTIPALFSEAAIAYVLRGANQSTPIDATTTTATGTDGSNCDPAPITTVTDMAWVVIIGAANGDGSSYTLSAPSGYSNATSIATGASPVNQGLTVASKLVATAGAENPGVFTGVSTNTGNTWCAVTLAIRPA